MEITLTALAALGILVIGWLCGYYMRSASSHRELAGKLHIARANLHQIEYRLGDMDGLLNANQKVWQHLANDPVAYCYSDLDNILNLQLSFIRGITNKQVFVDVAQGLLTRPFRHPEEDAAELEGRLRGELATAQAVVDEATRKLQKVAADCCITDEV